MRALITGITGQDGSYLAEQLTEAGHTVYGLVRGQSTVKREWLERLVPRVRLVEGDLLDQTSLQHAVGVARPQVVYHLGGITAPAIGWAQPVLMAEVTGLGSLRLLEAVRLNAPAARVVQACSLATHGPYGAAKTFARAIGADYRSCGLAVSNAIFGGHHSPRRGPEFFTRKVTRAAARISQGRQGQVELGSLQRMQDWGWAEDFTRVLPLVAVAPPDDYIISTGDPHSAEEWVRTAFAAVGLDWHDHVKVDRAMSQPTDVPTLTAPPDPRLEWTPNRDFEGLIRSMVMADLEAG